jgi:autotransporter-associated beta strand protein
VRDGEARLRKIILVPQGFFLRKRVQDFPSLAFVYQGGLPRPRSGVVTGWMADGLLPIFSTDSADNHCGVGKESYSMPTVARSDAFLLGFPFAKRWPVVFGLILTGSVAVYGQDSWQGPSGSWFTGSDWSSGVPTSNDTAIVDNGTTVQIVDGEAFVNTLIVGGTHPGSTVVLGLGGLLVMTNPLQIQNGGTFIYDGGQTVGNDNIVDNGTLEIVGGYGGLNVNVSGTGGLVINETTTIQIAPGTSLTYTGPTLVIGGTLQAGFAGAFSPNSAFTVNSTLDLNGFNNTVGSLSGTGTVFNDGATPATLTVGNDNSNSTFSGVLEDGVSVLQLTKSGTGVLTLTGANTYTGGTSISAGTLRLGNGGTTGSITGNVIDNGVLAFDRSDVFIFGGVISGTGKVVNLGSGTLTLAGTNTYTGTTILTAGVLKAGSTGAFSAGSAFTVNVDATLDLNGFDNTVGSLSGSGLVTNSGGSGDVLSNATLSVGADNTSTTFSGTLQDGVSSTLALDKVGTGTLILTGTNTYTGTTTVDNGSLIVNGSIASAITVVNPAGLLRGTGLIGGNLVNNGIVSPGNPTGTLTISGNYVQNSSGTLRIGVGGSAPGQFGVLAVNGHATLGGTLQIVPINGFQLAVGNKLTLLTATGGVSGNFSTIQDLFPNSSAVEAQFVILPGAVEIEGTQGSFVSILQSLGSVVTPNELAVAKALDSARGDPREAALFAFLNSQPTANLPHDLSLIAPTQISSINASVSIGKVQISNIGQRMANIHAGTTGFSSSGFTLNGEAPTFDSGLAGETGAEGKSGPSVLAPIPENRWGFFVTGLGEFTNVDSTPNANGYDVNTGGITLGVDYRVTPYFAVGLLGGYAHNNVSLDGGGNIDVNGGTFGAYATLFGNGFYLDTAVTGGPNGYDTHRTALQGSANGSTEGADVNVVVSAGYDWKHGNFSIGPTASFQFGYVGLDGFSETGSLAPLKFPDQNTESETTAFGARAMYEWKIGNITLIPQVSAAWQHEYGSVAYQVVAGFASGAGTNFAVNGPDIGRDSLLVGAGVSMIWSDRFSTYVFYDGDVARTNYDSHTVTGGFRITF